MTVNRRLKVGGCHSRRPLWGAAKAAPMKIRFAAGSQGPLWVVRRTLFHPEPVIVAEPNEQVGASLKERCE